MKLASHNAPLCPCPHCGHRMNGATNTPGPDQSGPKPGDLTICIECERVLKFTDKLLLRAVTEEEIQKHVAELRVTILAIKMAKKAVSDRMAYP